jgi:hypothetical protein
MQLLRARFTIRSLMIVVAIVGGLLAVPLGFAVIVLVGCIPCLAVMGSQWLVFRGHRRFAAFGFLTANRQRIAQF